MLEFLDWAKGRDEFKNHSAADLVKLGEELVIPEVSAPTRAELIGIAVNVNRPVQAFIPDLEEMGEDGTEKVIFDEILDIVFDNGAFATSPARNTASMEMAHELESLFIYKYQSINPTQLSIADLEELPENSYIYNVWAGSFVQLFVKTRFDLHGHREVRWYNVQGNIEDTEPYTSSELGRYRPGETAFTLLLRGKD